MVVFRNDPCGIFCVLLTYVAVFYADYVVIRWIALTTLQNSLWGPVHVVVFNVAVFLLVMAHVRAVFSDPGIVPLPQNRVDFSDMHSGSQEKFLQKEDWTVCTRCETYRPPRAHHCRICKRCVRRMDHHCPWINNCVGEWNQKYFIQFLMYVGFLSCYAVILVAASWLRECPDCPNEIDVKQARLLHSVILVLESVLFGLFVVAIMVDQLQAILSDETAVEHVKKQGPYRPRKPKMALLTEVCGRGPIFLWLFPCQGSPRNIEPLVDYDV